jgi:hypothetical protein
MEAIVRSRLSDLSLNLILRSTYVPHCCYCSYFDDGGWQKNLPSLFEEAIRLMMGLRSRFKFNCILHFSPHNANPMITRRKDGIVTQKLYPTLLLTELKPTHHKTALKDPKWVEALMTRF